MAAGILAGARGVGSFGLIAILALANVACGGGGATIRGSVTVLGQAASGVSVSLGHDTGEDEGGGLEFVDVVEETTTDEQGRYEFEGVEAGVYQVTADVVVPIPGLGDNTCYVYHGVDVTEGGTSTEDIDVVDADIQAFPDARPRDLVSGDFMLCYA